MNVLFIGPYRQNDGWGEASKDYIRALMKTDCNLSIKPIYLSSNVDQHIDPELEQLEHVKLDRIDFLIQNTLPNLLDYDYRAEYNIGLFFLETNGLKHNRWNRHINLMDEVWVSSSREKEVLRENDITVPVKIIPIPISLTLNTSAQILGEIPRNQFVFYFLGEYIHRKNLPGLITAFHREFHYSEPTTLVIKTSRTGMSQQEVYNRVTQDIAALKNTWRLYTQDLYKKDMLITSFLDEPTLASLHKSCNCFVMPSRGESLCRPLMDAMKYGSMVIGTKDTGMSDLVEKCGWAINSFDVPVVTDDPPILDLYTTHETWKEPDIIHLQKCMREAYNCSDEEKKRRIELGHQILDQYSHQSVAKKISKVLK